MVFAVRAKSNAANTMPQIALVQNIFNNTQIFFFY
jgi:hypothetical protein